jgi:hypothetical protein
LWMEDCQWQSASFKDLQVLKNLRRLILKGHLVNDTVAEQVAHLTDLAELTLYGGMITDKAAKSIAHLKSLRILSIGSAAYDLLTDETLREFCSLVELRSLSFGGGQSASQRSLWRTSRNLGNLRSLRGSISLRVVWVMPD